jgi:hypothetical protein
MKHLVYRLFFAAIIPFCAMFSFGQTGREGAPAVKLAVIRETLQTSKYTYLYVKEGSGKQWLAVPSGEFRVGDTCYYTGGLIMPDFTSKELNRTFDRVIFLESVSKTPDDAAKPARVMPEHGAKTNPAKLDLRIAPAQDGITIAELFKNKERYNGKVVKIRGQVTRFKSKIMGKNWAHLQDGTSFGDKFDLTATLSSTLAVGDIVTIEGMVAINKDFGSGYFFEIILEDAAIFR